jgi:antitoxin CptB
MQNDNNTKEAEQRRLAWRCRRGMLELDIVLQRFLAQHFNGLTNEELSAFDGLLALPDNEFWRVLQTNQKDTNNAALQAVVQKINALEAA